jgi:tRNA pseudouridine65 synthase
MLPSLFSLVDRFPARVVSAPAAFPWTRQQRLAVGTFAAPTASADPLAPPLKILKQTQEYVVVEKPPSVVCHHSDWTGSRSRNEVPMLQRVRDATCLLTGDGAPGGAGGDATAAEYRRRVNLVHRLDRGCSGCLLLAFASLNEPQVDDGGVRDTCSDGTSSFEGSVTADLIRAMQSPASTKTYVALVRGEGILRGVDFRERGWFLVDRPIKDENGRLNSASTWFRFAAGQDDAGGSRPRASLVLCRPTTGRWHQVRRHLNGLSHPILGDSSHGNSKVNQMWRQQYGVPSERTCLHLSRLQIPLGRPHSGSLARTPPMEDIDVACPLAPDMMHILERHLPRVLEKAAPILCDEGIAL